MKLYLLGVVTRDQQVDRLSMMGHSSEKTTRKSISLQGEASASLAIPVWVTTWCQATESIRARH